MSRTYRGVARHVQVYRLTERRSFRRWIDSLRWGAFGRLSIRGSK